MKRVILVFLKYPAPGRVKTRLAAELGADEAATIARQLACRVFEQCRRAAPDIIAIAYDPPEQREEVQRCVQPWLEAFPGESEWIPQVPGDLGERLEAATGEIFERVGEAAVAVIGTDCVRLDSNLFDECWTRLADGTDAVFGPAEDGGYYLVGLKEPRPQLFRGIPWSADDTLEVSLAAAGSAGLETACLASRFDVDTIEEWRRVRSEISERRAVFFDRDGVVNRSPGAGYVLSVDQFELNDGIAEALRWLKERDWLTVLVTSQKGVGKGLMSAEDLERIHRHMQRELLRHGAAFDGIYAYTGAPECAYRAKPDPGMIYAAAESFFIDLRQSWLIGDADRDIEMGISARLAGTTRILGDNEVTVPADHTLERVTEIPELLRKIL